MSRHTTEYWVFHLTPKPDLPQVAILHGVYVLPHARGNGLGHNLMQEITLSMKVEHFDAAICTTAGDNHAMQACLKKAGWGLFATFHNRKSNAPHQVWGITLNKGVQQ